VSKFKGWPTRQVVTARPSLDALIEIVKDQAGELSAETRAWLARLLIVRCSGYVEQVAFECFRGHILEKVGGPSRAFALTWIARSRNPTPRNLVDMVARFDQSWSDELEAYLGDEDDRLLRDMNYLVSARNNIAHGLNEGVTPRRAIELSASTIEVADWFILRFNPLR